MLPVLPDLNGKKALSFQLRLKSPYVKLKSNTRNNEHSYDQRVKSSVSFADGWMTNSRKPLSQIIRLPRTHSI